MKGIELPINILVIVAVAIIVLLGVIALFYSSWFGGTQPMSLEAAKAQACNVASRGVCATEAAVATPCSGIVVAYGTAADLMGLCQTYYGITASHCNDCLKQVCGMNQCV